VKLTPRFTLVFILYAAVLLLGVGLLAYNTGRESLRSATISELQATALEKEAALNQWVEEKRTDIIALADDPSTIEEVSILLTASPVSPEFRQAHDRLIADVEPRLVTGEFLEISILHPHTGQVIASTSPAEEGKFSENQPYFLNGKTGPYVQNLYYSTAQQSSAMTVSSPLHTKGGKLIGVLAARLDLNGMNEIINRRTGLHETDDAYLVNTSSLFVTQPRFIDNPAVLQRGIYTEAVDRCLREESGVVEAPDYRGIAAFVVYRWLSERQLCLVVKLDETEAFHSIREFGRTIAAISILALLVAGAIAIALARGMTHPILALQRGAARLANGQLDVRLSETSRDELGELASEFNKMAESLAEQQTYIRRRAEQFYNLTLDLLCTINASGRFMDLNPAWEHTLGYTRDELRGHLLSKLVHPDDIEATTSELQGVTYQNAGRFESRFLHKDGQYRWLAWVVALSPRDRLLYAAARDVTQRRLAEENLRQKTEELERTNQELEQFAYVASHDLQEPLHLVTGYVQLLGRRYKGKLDPDADEFIAFAMEGVNRMRNLISDLLAYSRISSSRSTFTPVMLEDTLQRVTENLQADITGTRTTITHDPLPSVLGDDEQMVQLLQNLIQNSIKFRGIEPPRIHVGVRQLEERWLVYVRDNGIGIDPQYTERVFVIFQRLHPLDQYPGTGIGLAICRKIVERHGGRIWVDSEPGKGSTFYFTLQPAEVWIPGQIPAGVLPPRSKDSVVDRASDLI
jgi:PAS domain S-box-containing protein